VDIQVLEVGLGGRLDATNIVEPLVAVITTVSLDHTALLGTNVADIAREKGGIIKEGVTVVSAPQKPPSLRVIEEICRDKAATLIPGGPRRDLEGRRGPRDGRGILARAAAGATGGTPHRR
jgi:dihydrofolate synthase/folylpolyglutamate synthase